MTRYRIRNPDGTYYQFPINNTQDILEYVRQRENITRERELFPIQRHFHRVSNGIKYCETKYGVKFERFQADKQKKHKIISFLSNGTPVIVNSDP